ncbi:MAG: inositol monophosphatase family protein [Candidatus Phytoplasma sp.]|nr:inositol monophosphatase family protein [Phytoplasma sp.]
MENYIKELTDIHFSVQKALKTLKEDKEILLKANEDLVTSSDLHIEKNIIEMIKTKYPADHILSEETYSDETLKNRTWIIDPIDGTSNYASSLGLYCIQVALYDQDDLVLSYLHLPDFNKTYHAIKNQGAFLNNQKIVCKKEENLSNALISFIGPYKKDAKQEPLTMTYLQKAADHNMKIRMLGSVGVELAFMAEGIFTAVYTTAKNIWDIAPGLLLIKEAGGYIAPNHGKPYQMGQTLFAWQNKKQYLTFLEDKKR